MSRASQIVRNAARQMRIDTRGDGHMNLGGGLSIWKTLFYWALSVAGWALVSFVFAAIYLILFG